MTFRLDINKTASRCKVQFLVEGTELKSPLHRNHSWLRFEASISRRFDTKILVFQTLAAIKIMI